jgi:hypothetical protein
VTTANFPRSGRDIVGGSESLSTETTGWDVERMVITHDDVSALSRREEDGQEEDSGWVETEPRSIYIVE